MQVRLHLSVHICKVCGITFGIPAAWFASGNHQKILCPAGHDQATGDFYGDAPQAELDRLLLRVENQEAVIRAKEEWDDDRSVAMGQMESTIGTMSTRIDKGKMMTAGLFKSVERQRRRISALKGVITKLKKREANRKDAQ